MVTVSHSGVLSSSNIAQALDSGERWTLPHQGDGNIHIPFFFEATNDVFRTAVRSALVEYSKVTNIIFDETNNSANGRLFFNVTQIADPNVAGQSTGVQNNISSIEIDDVFFANNVSNGGFNPGKYGYEVLLHEIGHSLGFKHPMTGQQANVDTPPYLGSVETSQPYGGSMDTRSVMIYHQSDSSPQSAHASTPMAYDMWAIEQLYGRNLTQTSGNTVYNFNNETLKKTVYDASGNDSFNASSLLTAVDIDLRPSFSFAQSDEHLSKIGNSLVWIDFRGSIENAIGGRGSDGINGNNDANNLDGGLGNDTIFGADGSDTINGGGGHDTLRGEIGADSILGGDGNDYIGDGVGANTVYGGAGNDTISVGNDGGFTDGGDGNDVIAAGNGSHVINGGNGHDNITSDGGNDTIQGSAGNDILNGLGGADSLLGGNGVDTLYGGDGNDRLYGEADRDLLMGEGGNDVLSGSAGNDTINGGGGRDAMSGGTGPDIFAFSALTDSTHSLLDTITDFEDGADHFQLTGLGFSHFTSQALTAAGELRGFYDTVTNRTYIHSDQTTFEFALTGNHITHISDADFIW